MDLFNSFLELNKEVVASQSKFANKSIAFFKDATEKFSPVFPKMEDCFVGYDYLKKYFK